MYKRLLVMAAVIGIAVIFCGVANYFSFGSIVPPPPKPAGITLIEQHPIVSLSRESGVSGAFILGFGTIDSDLYYVCYEKKDTNTFSLLKVKAEGTDVVEVDSVEPKYEVFDKGGIVAKRVLTVPKGTIKEEFKL